jgi:GMP reductase
LTRYVYPRTQAFGGGADFVMAGGMFASHAESGGELVEIEGKLYKQFYGMSSAVAMNKHSGKLGKVGADLPFSFRPN